MGKLRLFDFAFINYNTHWIYNEDIHSKFYVCMYIHTYKENQIIGKKNIYKFHKFI